MVRQKGRVAQALMLKNVVFLEDFAAEWPLLAYHFEKDAKSRFEIIGFHVTVRR